MFCNLHALVSSPTYYHLITEKKKKRKSGKIEVWEECYQNYNLTWSTYRINIIFWSFQNIYIYMTDIFVDNKNAWDILVSYLADLSFFICSWFLICLVDVGAGSLTRVDVRLPLVLSLTRITKTPFNEELSTTTLLIVVLLFIIFNNKKPINLNLKYLYISKLYKYLCWSGINFKH